jgi:hypothetical protein
VITAVTTTGTKIENATMTCVHVEAVYAITQSGEHTVAGGAHADELDRQPERARDV